jgi:hypothetical protein
MTGAIMIRKVLKIALLTFAGLLGLIAITVGGFLLHQYVTYDLPASKVEVVVKRWPEKCPEPYPVYVGVGNGSDRTITRTYVYVEARLPGRSTSYADYGPLSDDKIIPPGAGWAQCWPAKLRSYGTDGIKAADLEWSLDRFTVNFEK